MTSKASKTCSSTFSSGEGSPVSVEDAQSHSAVLNRSDITRTAALRSHRLRRSALLSSRLEAAAVSTEEARILSALCATRTLVRLSQSQKSARLLIESSTTEVVDDYPSRSNVLRAQHRLSRWPLSGLRLLYSEGPAWFPVFRCTGRREI